MRLKFGTWLAVALEFQLGADLVATTINPTLQSLGELAILAAVRTFLNYFLAKELEIEERVLKESREAEVSAKRDPVRREVQRTPPILKKDNFHG